MANKKIQIKNSAGDNLFPLVRKATIEDFSESDYASVDHTHAFTGTAKTISVSGTYVRPTGITINNITPGGTITLSRSANVSLSTTTISQITDVGTLPTREQVSVVTGVSGGGGSRTLSYLHYIAPTSTKGSYTPAGSISRRTSVTLSNNTGLCKASVPDGGTTLVLESITVSVSTQPTFTFIGTPTTTLVTSISGGSLTANTTSSGGIKVVSDASFTNASATTSNIYQITGVGTLPTMDSTIVATSISTQPNFTVTFSGTSTSVSGSITTSNTSITLSGSYTPEGTIGSAN